MYATIVKAGIGDPRAEITHDTVTLKPHDYGKRRVGQPRTSWAGETSRAFWENKGG